MASVLLSAPKAFFGAFLFGLFVGECFTFYALRRIAARPSKSIWSPLPSSEKTMAPISDSTDDIAKTIAHAVPKDGFPKRPQRA